MRLVLVLLAAAFGLTTDAPSARTAAELCRPGIKTPTTGRAQPARDLYADPGSPERRSLRGAGVRGVLLTLSGHVYDERCTPAARVMLDFFHADSRGKYDRREIRFHGHQYTDAEGRYLLETIVPNRYLRRAPHIHVAVQSDGGPLLTTQLFFPGSLRAYGMNVAASNAHDPGFERALVVHLSSRQRNHYWARFDFVIAAR